MSKGLSGIGLTGWEKIAANQEEVRECGRTFSKLHKTQEKSNIIDSKIQM